MMIDGCMLGGMGPMTPRFICTVYVSIFTAEQWSFSHSASNATWVASRNWTTNLYERSLSDVAEAEAVVDDGASSADAALNIGTTVVISVG